MLEHERRLLLVRRPAPPRAPLLLLAGPAAPALAAGVAAPGLPAAQPPDGVEDLVGDVLQDVEDAQLVPGGRPDLGQHRRVEVGAVGHDHLGQEAPVARARRKRRMWAWSLTRTRRKPTTRSARGSVASSRV